MTRRLVVLTLALLTLVLAWAVTADFRALVPLVMRPAGNTEVRGTVVHASGPVSGATVRLQATANAAQTDEHGQFALTNLAAGVPVTITAWSDGYFVGWCSTTPGDAPITITLRPYYTTDNAEYDWFSLRVPTDPRAVRTACPRMMSGKLTLTPSPLSIRAS